MKKILMAFTALLLSLSVVQAQSPKYEAAMKKNLLLLDSAKTGDDYKKISSSFERIADAEKTQWLPYYYAGLALTLQGFVDEKADKDPIGVKALELADKAAAINDNAEVYGIKYMAYIVQMLVNPMERYITFGAKAQKALQDGLAKDSVNARLYYLKGTGILNTPTFAGGGPEKAKPILEKALEYFNAEKPLPLYPHWGKEQTIESLSKCK